MTLPEQANSITSLEDLIIFIRAFYMDFNNNKEQWENTTLENFLEAMSAWAEDTMEHHKHLKTTDKLQLNWKFFADLLMAARVYE